MNYSEHVQIERRIERLLCAANTVQEEELKAELAKYICILSSGFIEASCRDMVRRYALSKGSEPTLLTYIESTLRRFYNPDLDRILTLVGSFDADKRNAIESTVDESLSEAITSIVSNRRRLAHGANVGISLAQISDYFERAKKYLTYMERKFIAT